MPVDNVAERSVQECQNNNTVKQHVCNKLNKSMSNLVLVSLCLLTVVYIMELLRRRNLEAHEALVCQILSSNAWPSY